MRVRIAQEGIALTSGIVVTLTIAMSYANNLAYLFAFAIVGFCLVSFVVGYAELGALEIMRVEVDSAHEGEELRARVLVRNRSTRDASVAFLAWQAKQRRANNTAPAITIVGPGATATLELAWQGEQRGKFALPPIELATTHPAGFLRWSRAITQSEFYFVYPRRRGRRPRPDPCAGLAGEGESGTGRGDDFHGHRAFQPGEPERHIDWKLAARSGQRMVKEFRGGSELHFWFERADVSGLDFSEALEQIAAWAAATEGEGLAWGMAIGDVRLDFGRGSAHLRRTLELLAVARDERSGTGWRRAA